MDEVSAGIGIEQLKKFDKSNKKRLDICKRYEREIKISEKIPFNNECSYHLYWILVKDRKKFMKKMSSKNIETGTHYAPVHSMSFYKSKEKLPITDDVAKKIVTIPIHPRLSDKDVDHIIKTINSSIK